MRLTIFHHKQKDRLSIIKYFLFWFAMLSMLLMLAILINKNNIQIPQKEITLNVDIKDKVNICLPDKTIK
jgi:hypothetical protein